MRGNIPRSVTGEAVIDAMEEKSASADDIFTNLFSKLIIEGFLNIK
jgi:hypothetical protein